MLQKFKKRFAPYVKRIPPVIAVLVFLVSMFVLPAAASEPEYITTDFLITSDYYYRSNNGALMLADAPTHYFSGVTSAEWYFPVSQNLQYDFLYVTVYAAKQPTTLSAKYSMSGSYVTGEYVGMYDGVYQYKIPCGGSVRDLYIRSTWGSSYSGEFSVLGCTGFYLAGVPVSQANFYYYDSMIIKSPAQIVQEHVATEQFQTLPHEKLIYKASEILASKSWNYTTTLIDLPETIREFNNIGSLTFLIEAPNMTAPAICLYNKGEYDPVQVVPLTIEEVAVTSVTYSNQPVISNYWNLNYYRISCDLSEFDLEGKTIGFSCRIEPSAMGPSYTGEFTYSRLISVNYTPHVEDLPWYATFWGWLSGALDRLSNGLISGIGESFEAGTDKIVEGVENSANSTNDILNGGDRADEIEEKEQDINSAISDLENFASVIDDYEVPDIDSSSIIESATDLDPSLTGVLSTISNADHVLLSMTISVFFSLVGFLIFGRG